MSTTNSNYSARVTGFDVTDFYQAAAVGPFNQLSNGSLAAFVLFIVRGEYQQLGQVNPDSQFLWGNLDAALFTGWSLSIEPGTVNPQAPMLRASLGDGVAVNFAESEVFMDVGGPSVIERLCLAGLFWDGDNGTLCLTLNGAIVAVASTGVGAYVPSASAARLGTDPPGAVSASFVDFVACGYGLTALPLSATDRTIGAFAGGHFRSAREGLKGGFYFQSQQGLLATDWVHRYEAGTLGQGNTGTISKSASGASLTTLPAAPLVWTDVGSAAPGMVPSPVNLTREGSLLVSSCKNPDWAVPTGYPFPGLPA